MDEPRTRGLEKFFKDCSSLRSCKNRKPSVVEVDSSAAVFADCSYYGNSVAETLFEKGLCLPSGSNTSEFDKQQIKAIFDVFLEIKI